MAEPAKILIVDDERDLVDAYVRLLERSGYRCAGAYDATQAFQMIDADPPDVVITDLSLPDNTGVEIVRRVRARLPGAPIVVISGHNSPGLHEAARAAGADVSLLKPVSITDLRRVIGQALAH
jgi:CheY-like chemotaxis protein